MVFVQAEIKSMLRAISSVKARVLTFSSIPSTRYYQEFFKNCTVFEPPVDAIECFLVPEKRLVGRVCLTNHQTTRFRVNMVLKEMWLANYVDQSVET